MCQGPVASMGMVNEKLKEGLWVEHGEEQEPGAEATEPGRDWQWETL